MRQGTTPTIVINVNNIDLSELKSVYITFEQDGYLLRKDMSQIEIEDDEIRITLTQEETLKFKKGIVNVQLRAITQDGTLVDENGHEILVDWAYEVESDEVGTDWTYKVK